MAKKLCGKPHLIKGCLYEELAVKMSRLEIIPCLRLFLKIKNVSKMIELAESKSMNCDRALNKTSAGANDKA